MPPGAVPDSASVSRRMLADRRCGHVRVLADHARPPAGARCGKAARRDLCGGQGAIPVPTATGFPWISCAPGSWRCLAGESPVRVGRSGRPVASVAWLLVTAVAKRTQQLRWGGLLSCESQKIAGAEALGIVEGNMCGAVMRGAVALPWSKIPSRANRRRRNLGDLVWPAVAHCDPGPRREGEEPKLPWNRRGVGRAS